MTNENRDDFSPETKRRVAQRAGYVCSYPKCAVHTAGPSDEAHDAVSNIGVAAHITAAAPGGRRYDPSLSPEERADIGNAIWLCQNHAKAIDTDEATWTAEVLRGMKKEAEAAARDRQAGSTTGRSSLSVDATACVYLKSYRVAYVPAEIVNEGTSPVTIRSVQLRLEQGIG